MANSRAFFAALGLAGALCAQDQAAAPSALSTAVEVGIEARVVDGNKTFGFQKYRDVPRGAFFRRLDFSWLEEGNPRRFTFRSVDLIQRDQVIGAMFEDVGKHKLQFDWIGWTRFWSNHNPSVLTEVRRGVFTAPAGLRAALELAPETLLPALAFDAAANAPQIEIRSFRERGFVTYTYRLRGDATLRLQYMGERRSGNRLFAQGTYNRIGTSLGDTFETPGQEFFEPTRYRTQEFLAELNFARKSWLASFEYRASLFNNHALSVVRQNPFRFTPAQATPPAGALLRGRFAQTQAALPPDNQAHTFSFNGMILLPRTSRVAASISWSRWTQDEPLLPFTINEAITAPNLPAGTPPTSLAALPQRSLNGLIHTLNQDYSATTRLTSRLQLTARYNDYDLSNETHEIRFPGYSAFGDSFWRTEITGQPGTTPLPIETEPKEFRRRRLQLESALRPGRDLSWKAAYRFDRFHRERRQVRDLDEHGFLTSLSYAPRSAVFAQAGFRYFDRSFDRYDPGTLEPPFLRMFDQAERIRRHGDALASVNVLPDVTLSASWFYISDAYDEGFFGLHQVKTNSVTADVSWDRENFGVFAGWGYDRMGYDYLSVAKTGAPYNFRDTWTRDTRDRIHQAHAGFSGSLLGGKGVYQANYAVGLARTRINTANPLPVIPADTLNAQAHPFPAVQNQLHEVRLDASYEVRTNLRLGVFYLLEPYRLNDFARDTIEPYAPGNIAPENDARRYLFLEIGPTNYTGNLIAFYVRYNLF